MFVHASARPEPVQAFFDLFRCYDVSGLSGVPFGFGPVDGFAFWGQKSGRAAQQTREDGVYDERAVLLRHAHPGRRDAGSLRHQRCEIHQLALFPFYFPVARGRIFAGDLLQL